jgi:iron complex transport system substrate-binding protein
MFNLLTSIFLILGLVQEPRVISLAPSITQIVRELGVEPVGVSDFCEAGQQAQRLGGLSNPNLEAIIKLKPDYVLLLGNHDGLSAKLKDFKITVNSYSNHTVAQIIESVRQIGEILAKQQQASEIIKSLEIRNDKLKTESKVALLIAGDYSSFVGLIAAGRSSLYGELLENLGAKNIFQGSFPYPSTSLENLLSSKPDRIVFFLNPGQEIDDQSIKKTFGQIEVSVIKDSSLLVPGLNITTISKELYQVLQ